MLSNVYLIPRLLGRHQEVIDMWHPSNRSERRYTESLPDELFAVWEPLALEWVRTVEVLVGTVQIHGDIVAPVLPPEAWDVERHGEM